jgi:hypothetical protein
MNEEPIKKTTQEERKKNQKEHRKLQSRRDWFININFIACVMSIIYAPLSAALFTIRQLHPDNVPKAILKIPIEYFLNPYILIIAIILFLITSENIKNTNIFVSTTEKLQEINNDKDR